MGVDLRRHLLWCLLSLQGGEHLFNLNGENGFDPAVLEATATTASTSTKVLAILHRLKNDGNDYITFTFQRIDDTNAAITLWPGEVIEAPWRFKMVTYKTDSQDSPFRLWACSPPKTTK